MLDLQDIAGLFFLLLPVYTSHFVNQCKHLESKKCFQVLRYDIFVISPVPSGLSCDVRVALSSHNGKSIKAC